ncbi:MULTISPECIES: hypothetical protein [Deferrisoma]
MFDAVPYSVLIPLAVLMALAPFHPKPHLVEKVQMLLAGDLRRPLDIFDLVLHSAPLAALLLKWLWPR